MSEAKIYAAIRWSKDMDPEVTLHPSFEQARTFVETSNKNSGRRWIYAPYEDMWWTGDDKTTEFVRIRPLQVMQ